MAEVTFTPLEAGDTFSAASVNTLVSGVANAVNDVEEDASSPGAFNDEHLPSLVLATATITVGGPGASLHSYSGATYPYPATWTEITQGGINYRLDMGSIQTIGASMGGCFVTADVFISRISDIGGTDGAGSKVFLRLEVSLDGVAWTPINRTERYVASGITGAGSAGRFQKFHAPIRTLIKAGDIAGDRFRYIRGTLTLIGDATLRECTLAAFTLHAARE